MTADVRCTVCELPDPQSGRLAGAWARLVEHVRDRSTDVVLLPEMPFHPWVAARAGLDDAAWSEAVAAHERWEERFSELGTSVVAGTRPVLDDGRRYNEGFVWTPNEGARGVHRKVHLPDEEGFREASCYDPGPPRFETVSVSGLRMGFLICTELWFLERAREFGADGVELLLCPRATPAEAADKWLAGGRVASVVSGAYCLSSNRGGRRGTDERWAGRGWITHPEHGDLLGVTSTDHPFVTLEIDPSDAARARETYPRYVPG